MRKGFDAALVFDEQGEIFAFGTGSDATSEHEQGSKKMQDALCDPANARPPAGKFTLLLEQWGVTKRPPLSDDELIAALRAGKSVQYPELLLRKSLCRNLDKLHFVTGTENGQPVVLFGFSPSGLRVLPIDHPELRMREGVNTSGAWDDREFAIKVRGEELVAKLKRFTDAVKAGDGLFAGTFLRQIGDVFLSGVIVARHSKLTLEHQADIAKAQKDWEANLRLKARSRVEELQALSRGRDKPRHVHLPGFIWPVWTDGPDSDIVYALNPSYEKYGRYFGPYEFDELKKWILAEEKYQLTPIERVTA